MRKLFLALVLCLASAAQAQSEFYVRRGGGSSGSSLPGGGTDGQVLGKAAGTATWLDVPSAPPGTNGQLYETQSNVGVWRYGRGTGTGSEVNVKDYGAKCDGTTNDTTSINNAIASGAARVFIPGGTCVITGITIPADSSSLDAPSFELVGIGFPKLLVTSATNAVGITVSKQRYVTIRNLQIYSSGTKGDGNNTVGIKYVANTSRQSIDHVRIVGFSGIGLQQIQGLVHDYRNIDIRSNTWAISIEKNGVTVATTTTIDNAYITSCTRGVSSDGLVSAHFNRLTFETCGSSSTNDGALHFMSGTRGVKVTQAYFESTDGRNIYSNDARWTMDTPLFVGTATAPDVYIWSGVSATNRAQTTITNDTVSTKHIVADPNSTSDADITLARSSAATSGAINLSNSQSLQWRNNANSADIGLSVSGSDRLLFDGNTVPTLTSTDTLSNKTIVSPTANPAASGIIRLANLDGVNWRNAANSASLSLRVNGSDKLQFNSIDLVDASTAQTLTNKTLTSPALTTPVLTGGTFSTLTSQTANPAAAGQFRLAVGDTIQWRNNANSGNLSLAVNGSDQLTFNGTVLGAGGGGGGGVTLQGSTPGVADTGHIHVTGTIIADANLSTAGNVTASGNVSGAQVNTNGVTLYSNYIGNNLGSTTIAATLHQIGAMKIQAMATPAAPVVTNVGTPGTTTYTYYVVCKTALGKKSTVSAAGTTTTGNATLDGTNYNSITFTPPQGSSSCDVLKTNTTTLLANVAAPLTGYQDQGGSTSGYTQGVTAETADLTADGLATFGRGALLGPIATASLPTTCVNGTLIWDSTSQTLKQCVSNAWSNVGGGSGGVTLQGSTPGTADTGNINVSGAIIAGTTVKGTSGLIPGAFATGSLPGTCTDGQIAWDSTTQTEKRCLSNAWANIDATGGVTLRGSYAAGSADTGHVHVTGNGGFDSGIYLNNAGTNTVPITQDAFSAVYVLGLIANNGFGAVQAGSLTSATTSLSLIGGGTTNVANAVGTIIDTSVTLSNATSKIASIRNNGTQKAYFGFAGQLVFDATDSSGTPGAATINKPEGQVAIAASASSVVVTNSLVSTTSVVFAVLQANDSTCTSLKSVVPASGSFTINVNANCTAATKVGFVVH